MKFDIKEIATAWLTKVNPTEEQKQLAEQRATICSNCSSVAEGIGEIKYCSICKCIIAAKIYSPRENPCPLAKWKCDIPYFDKKINKHKLI